MNNIEKITSREKVLAMIVKSDFYDNGIRFFTPDDYSQQMAYMHHPKDHVILPHIHNRVKREVFYTNEVLIIKSGKIKCDFYDDNKKYIQSAVLNTGDLILLISGGHGFECLEETEMYEIKQGPYAGENDKTRFRPDNHGGAIDA